MYKRLQYLLTFFSVLIFTASVSSQALFAQESIGGPYQKDSATVLLMHFNDNFNIKSNFNIAPANDFGVISFTSLPGAGELNQQVRFNNQLPSYKSHLQIPDTTALDLTGNWTMEMWVNVFTFGQTQDDWRRGPRLYFKPGDPEEEGSFYFTSNYFFNLNGQPRIFNTGYNVKDQFEWIQISSPENTLRAGEWFHLTFIRDTTKEVIVQLIQQNANDPGRLPNEKNAELKTIHFETEGFDMDTDHPPRLSDQPLFIGTSPQNDTSSFNLDGWMDEVRISNVVRNFNLPPLISEPTDTATVKPNEPFTVGAKMQTIGTISITNPTLHYRINDGSWKTKSLSEGADAHYTADIPGQSTGSTIDYYFEASTDAGKKAYKPDNAVQADTVADFYSAGVVADSTKVLALPFNGLADGDMPVDSSLYGLDVTYNGAASPTYVSGTKGNALQFTASDSTFLEVDSPILSLNSFGLQMDFMMKDSIPQNNDVRLIIKRSGAVWQSNYQIYINSNPVHVRPASRVPGNECAGFMGGTLNLGSAQALETDKWYEVGFTMSQELDTAITYLADAATDSLLAVNSDCVTENPNTGEGPLRIGAEAASGPFFNGVIDEVKLWNYSPDRLRKDTVTSIKDSDPILPREVTLAQNYPNPFNPTTNITYSLPQATNVQLAVYDVLGRRVATLVNGKRQAGSHQVTFDATNLSSGVYLYRLKTGEVTKTRKMLLVK